MERLCSLTMCICYSNIKHIYYSLLNCMCSQLATNHTFLYDVHLLCDAPDMFSYVGFPIMLQEEVIL
jgi:hypothetical protein